MASFRCILSLSSQNSAAATSNNKVLADAPVFASEAHASDYLRATISKNPAMTEDIHVIPSFEAAI